MKWPSDFPHMTRGNGPILIGYEGIGGWFAYKGSQWFSVKKRKDGEPLEADRDVELVTDPAILAKLGPAEALVADERPDR